MRARNNPPEAPWLGRAFGIPDAPHLWVRPVPGAAFSVTHLRLPVSVGGGVPVALPSRESYLVLLHLRDAWYRGAVRQAKEPSRHPHGSIRIVDLADGAAFRVHGKLHALGFHIPKLLVREVAEFSAAAGMTGLQCVCCRNDPTVANLGTAILPLFHGYPAGRAELLHHLAIALCAHLLHVYGLRCDAPRRSAREIAATDFMTAHCHEAISVAAVAAAVGLSRRHFGRWFKSRTGKPPYQWLTHHRVACAKRALADRGLTVDAIAVRCGFSTRRRFCAAFRAETGRSPADWRKHWFGWSDE